MDARFWLEKWDSNQIGFHEDVFHPMLLRHWDAVGIADEAPVFVPLCGKSRDMLWLASRGHPVVGVELSDVAVRAFFDDVGIECTVDTAGPFARYRGGAYTLYRGDLFDLTREITGPFGAFYDRASLIALPPATRADYVALLRSLCAPDVRGLLVTVDYPEDAITPPPFIVPDDEVERRYSSWCRITALGRAEAEVKGQPAHESAFGLHVR